HGDFHNQLTMARSLIRLAGETSPDDRKHGLEVLRRLARSGADYQGAVAADALATYGDLSPVAWYYTELRNAVSVPGREWGHSIPALFYLAAHGSRKEWELLYEIAVTDL